MFADDTQIETAGYDVNTVAEELNQDLENVSVWLSANKLTLNKTKTEYMIIVEVSGLKDTIVRVEDELIEAKQLLNEKVVVLQNVIVNLEEKVARFATKANDNEQYSRRYNIRVSGFPEESDENCSLKVGQLCRETLMLPDFSEEQIDRINRVGKPRSDGKSRAIIVRFKSHKYKLNVLQAKNKLRNTPFSINEDLTRQNQQLFYIARTGCTNVSSAWTIDGRIFAKRRSDDRKFNIVRYTDFEEYDLM
ncbi:Hypothetical predicted protein [Paramuricea clavata]|uniref:Uncharacterized protein n=1 Tax=Paramuricea clavata TaxID=317549 RepID=A0A7D9DQY2_PARCT|nr:Hypothetical predicted protein [Paramuricea clavata]